MYPSTSPLNWPGKKTHFLLDILETIRSIGASKIWDATTGSGEISYFLSCQPDLIVHSSDIDPDLIRFHRYYSKGWLTELGLKQWLNAYSAWANFSTDEMSLIVRHSVNEEILNGNKINPLGYYLWSKTAYGSNMRRTKAGFFNAPGRMIDPYTIKIPRPNDHSKRIKWFVFDVLSSDFEEKSKEYDLVILDPPYFRSDKVYKEDHFTPEWENQTLLRSNNLLYFQRHSDDLENFAYSRGYPYTIKEKKAQLGQKKGLATLKEIMIHCK